jgi:hypothetical protein
MAGEIVHLREIAGPHCLIHADFEVQKMTRDRPPGHDNALYVKTIAETVRQSTLE